MGKSVTRLAITAEFGDPFPQANPQLIMLEREEYIEQAYFFRALGERLPENMPLQDLLAQIAHEILSTTKLPLAIGFLLTELNHCGVMATAMARLPHYFTPFQTYIIQEAESERGRFDMRIAIQVLRFEAEYRSKEPTPQGLFMYQFETLCRNRLSYDRGLKAVSQDPMYDQRWSEWILMVRRNIGIVEFADLLYTASHHYVTQKSKRQGGTIEISSPILFGEKEGKIALANRKKDPLFLFATLQRQLGYPAVPRPLRKPSTDEVVPQILRRLERLEVRMKLLEEEQREGAFDLSKFYQQYKPKTDVSKPGESDRRPSDQ